MYKLTKLIKTFNFFQITYLIYFYSILSLFFVVIINGYLAETTFNYHFQVSFFAFIVFLPFLSSTFIFFKITSKFPSFQLKVNNRKS
jgi:hypothetical protein